MTAERSFDTIIGEAETPNGDTVWIDRRLEVRAQGITAAAELAVQEYLESEQRPQGAGTTFSVAVLPKPTAEDPYPEPWTMTVYADSRGAAMN